MLCLAEDSSQDVRRDEDGTIGKNPPIITCFFDVGEHVISEAILNSTASRETNEKVARRRDLVRRSTPPAEARGGCKIRRASA